MFYSAHLGKLSKMWILDTRISFFVMLFSVRCDDRLLFLTPISKSVSFFQIEKKLKSFIPDVENWFRFSLQLVSAGTSSS